MRMLSPTRQRTTTGRRGAALYAIVMSTSLIVSLLGLAALNVMRIERRSALGGQDATKARRYAQAAVEMGLLRIQNDPNWRTTYSSGVWESSQPIGDGTYTLEGIDPNDENHATPATDPVVLIGTGVMGSVRQKIQVTLVPNPQGLSCLEVALHAGRDLSFTASAVQCNQTISANGSVSELGDSSINGDVEAVNTISGDNYLGTTTTGITPRTMPDSTVFDYYLANGTIIDFASLPSGEIFKALLSPASNPFSQTNPPETNPEGIYVIDCAGAMITIESSRIVGTLVLLNPRSDSRVKESIHWETAVANYPALLVSGDMNFNFENTTLSEATQEMSFNPPGTPYAGVEDTDTLDEYPSVIKGLVYVSGDAGVSSKNPAFDGVLVVGTTLIVNGKDIDLTYQPTFLNNPPPGFGASATMKVSPGSWQKRVD